MVFVKYCPNVFVIKSDKELKKGDKDVKELTQKLEIAKKLWSE